MSDRVGFFWPAKGIDEWLISAPPGWVTPAPSEIFGRPVPDDWREVVLQHRFGCGVVVSVERFGLIDCNFAEWALGSSAERPPVAPMDHLVATSAWWLRFINSLLLMVHVAYLELENLEVIAERLSHFDTLGLDDQGASGSHKRQAIEKLLVKHFDLLRNEIVPVEMVAGALDLLDSALGEDPTEILVLLDLLSLGVTASQHHDAAQALIAAWSICERWINQEWLTYIREKTQGDRLDRLKKGRDYTAAVRIETLEFAGIIDQNIYRQLSAARKLRNDWMHELREPDRGGSLEALHTSAQLLSRVTGLNLRIQPAQTVQI